VERLVALVRSCGHEVEAVRGDVLWCRAGFTMRQADGSVHYGEQTDAVPATLAAVKKWLRGD